MILRSAAVLLSSLLVGSGYAAAITSAPASPSNSVCTKGVGSQLASYISAHYPKEIPAIRTYCSSKYPVPTATVTKTAATHTFTTTVTTETATTDVATSIISETTVVTTEFIPTTVATVTSVATTAIDIETTDVTTIEIVTSTVTAIVQNPARRGSPPQPFPTCEPELWTYLKSHPKVVSAACACIETQQTQTKTVTPSVTATAIAVTTVPVTVYDTTVISVSDFSYEYMTFVSDVATTTTMVVTSVVTQTNIATSAVATTTANANPNTLGTGGCSGNCYCDTAYDNGTTNEGICNDSIACGMRCNSGLDCPIGQSCIMDSSTGPCGGPTCVDTTGCSTTYTQSKKRGAAAAAFHSYADFELTERLVGVSMNRTEFA